MVWPVLLAGPAVAGGRPAGGCAVLVVVLGVPFAGQGTADPFDRVVDAPVVAWFAGHPALALWMAYPATLVPAGGVSLIAALACLARGWLRGAVLALLAVPVASGLNDALFKHLFHRTYLGQLTYPSGHAAAATALAAALTVLLLPPGSPPPSPPPGTGRAGLRRRPGPAARRARRARRDRPDDRGRTALRWAVPAVAWLAVAVVRSASSACAGTTSPTPSGAPPSAPGRSAGSRWSSTSAGRAPGPARPSLPGASARLEGQGRPPLRVRRQVDGAGREAGPVRRSAEPVVGPEPACEVVLVRPADGLPDTGDGLVGVEQQGRRVLGPQPGQVGHRRQPGGRLEQPDQKVGARCSGRRAR